MSPLEHMAGPPAGSPRPPVARGRVIKPPASPTDAMTVTLVNYSSAWEFEIPASNWTTTTALPAQGDVCVVLFDDDGDAWVPTYGPET
jgi:hypothetical protein